MEDDDDFGDLYTDVLQPLQMSSAPPQPPVQSTSLPNSRSIDLNDRIPSDDEEILYGAKSSGKLKFDQPDLNLNLNKRDVAAEKTEKYWGEAAAAEDPGGRVLGSSNSLVNVEEKNFEQDPNLMNDVKGETLQIKDDTLEENFGIEDAGEEDEFLIPGLSSSGARVLERGGKEGIGVDDWDDSDSEDDLQIVLNDNTGGGMMGMDGVGGQDEEDDEDGDNLVIVAGNDDPNLHHHPPIEEMQDWGEDANQAAEGGGERKDILGGDSGKADGGAVAAQKIGYGGHGYQPFHSQFKYVRPGAALMPGAAPVATGGAVGQVRPPASMLPFAGRGRGEWRPAGIKNAPPMQKSFHPGYGTPGWGNNGAGRGFGSGLDFTLPSHKTIFEVDIDGFEEKPWRLQGIDISDFFNFGMNEESWKEYCKQLEQHRLEATMQSKIRVYESGRTEQEYDPDLPPELAAAAGHDIPSDNRNIGKIDVQGDLAKGSARARMQLPTGKAIQVETGFGERLPSIDTRPPRLRDSDAIIEIVLQRSPEDESVPENDGADQPEDVPLKENHREGHEMEDIRLGDDHFDRPHAYNVRKKEVSGRRTPFMGSGHDVTATIDETSHFSETEVEDNLDSRGRTSSYPSKKHNSPRTHVERPSKRTAADKSPHLTDSGTPQDKKFVDNQNEESTESVGHKQSPPSSPLTYGSAEARSFDQNDALKDEDMVADGNSGMEREGRGLDTTAKDEKSRHTVKKQKLNTRAENSSVERGEDREDSKAGRSSENSKARSGSSRDQPNMQDSIEPEVFQSGSSMRSGNIRKTIKEDELTVRSRGRDERHDRERHQIAMKEMGDQYSHRKWDSNQGYRPHGKSENFDRKKGREYEGVGQDEDPNAGRMKIEDTRKRSHDEEMVSRHRYKVRENERSDKNEHRSRKALENGSWKGEHDRDMVSQSKRDRQNTSEGIHGKRASEEVHARRVDRAEREESLHAHRRKRERDDHFDQHKRDDDQHSFRYKEEARLQREKVDRQRERDEWKERDGHRGSGSGRAVEEKSWVGHSRSKEDYRSSDKDYQFKETVREQSSRRDRVENESVSRHRGREDAHAHGNKLNNEERMPRHERGYTGSDRSVNAKEMHGVPEKKHKENPRKIKDTDSTVHNSVDTSRRNREDLSNLISERASSRGVLEQQSGEQNPVSRRSSKKHKENASSEDEQQESKRGRSKLERWTSHKERDFSLVNKTSPSLDPKETTRYNDNGASTKLPEESSKPQEVIENPKLLAEEKDKSLKNEEAKPAEDKHLDTVEKLKKRSERFKLPMPSEKETLNVRKMENEPLPSVQPETRPDSEVKPERPARKRRWTSG